MDIREVCLTAICANEDGQKALGDISTDDLKRQLVGSHYRLYDLEMETEDIMVRMDAMAEETVEVIPVAFTFSRGRRVSALVL